MTDQSAERLERPGILIAIETWKVTLPAMPSVDKPAGVRLLQSPQKINQEMADLSVKRKL